MNMYIYGIILVASFFVSYFSVPFTIKIANKYNIIDNPKKDDRKIHSKPIPRAGGMAIVMSMAISLLIYFVLTIFFDSLKIDMRFVGYIIGAMIISVMGFLDDFKGLTTLEKLLFQVVAASVIYLFGISIIGVQIPIIYNNIIDFGIFAYPITLLWILGITNAVNLIDGLDGLAAGITTISTISLLAIFLITGAPLQVIVMAMALVGASLGFLPYNLNPARTFMGDVGSNFLGFTLSVISIMGMAKGYTVLAIVAPIIILGIPVIDMVFAVLQKVLKKQKITTLNRDNIHYKLLNLGMSQKQSVLTLYAITSILGVIAVALVSNIKWHIILLVIILVNIAGIYFVIKYKNKKEDKKLELNNKSQV